MYPRMMGRGVRWTGAFITRQQGILWDNGGWLGEMLVSNTWSDAKHDMEVGRKDVRVVSEVVSIKWILEKENILSRVEL